MTLVYERSDDGPRTHALILGVGKFSHLPAPNVNRQACADTARAMIELLIKHADNLASPLGSIEVLISDPSAARDAVPMGDPLTDRRSDDRVDAATLANTMTACASWRSRVRPGDSVFFFGCSHGVAGRDERALLVLEDAGKLSASNWHELLDVESIAKFAAAELGAGAVWVFFDACQEVVPTLSQAVDGARAFRPMSATVLQLARCTVDALFLASSRTGQTAYAPAHGGLAYFTEALIAGLDRCLIEQHFNGWAVTGRAILFNVDKVRRALGGALIFPMSLSPFNQRTIFSILSDPRILVAVSTMPSNLLLRAVRVEAFDISNGARTQVAVRTSADPVWRFEISPDVANLEIEVDLGQQGVKTRAFKLEPPAVLEEVV